MDQSSGYAVPIGSMHREEDPEIISVPKINFDKVCDDVNALCWVPDSLGHDLLAATRDSLLKCDIRASYSSYNQIEESTNKEIVDIKFEPNNPNRFATLSKESIKVYDMRIT